MRQCLVLRDLLGDGDIDLPNLYVDLLEACIDLIFEQGLRSCL